MERPVVLDSDTLQDNARGHHFPMALRLGDRTVVGYVGPDDGSGEAPVRVVEYDHGTGRWSAPVEIDATTFNFHYKPALAYDEAGRVHAFYGSWNEPLRHRVAEDPTDEASWTELPDVDDGLTYAVAISDGESIQLFTRHQDRAEDDHPVRVYSFTGGAESYDSWETLVATGDAVYPGGAILADGVIHFRFNVRERADGEWGNAIYSGVVGWRPSDGALLGADGSEIAAPASLDELRGTDSLIAGDGEREVHGTGVDVAAGTRHVAYVEEGEGGSFDLKHARYDGGWRVTTIAEDVPANGWRAGRFVRALPLSARTVRVYDTLWSFAGENGMWGVWESDDAGETWTGRRQVHPGTGFENGIRNWQPAFDGERFVGGEASVIAAENGTVGDTFPEFYEGSLAAFGSDVLGGVEAETVTRAHLSEGQAVPSGVRATVAFDATTRDDRREFDPVGHAFVAAEEASYEVSAGLRVAAEGAERFDCSILVNGEAVRVTPTHAAAGEEVGVGARAEVGLTDGDRVTVGLSHDAGGNRAIRAGETATAFEVARRAGK